MTTQTATTPEEYQAALAELNEENLSLHDRVAELEEYLSIMIRVAGHMAGQLHPEDGTAAERDLAAGQTAALLAMNTAHIYPLLRELAGTFPGSAAEMTRIAARLDDAADLHALRAGYAAAHKAQREAIYRTAQVREGDVNSAAPPRVVSVREPASDNAAAPDNRN